MSAQQRSKRPVLITLITVTAVALAGAGAWAAVSYRDAQVSEEARAYAAAVHRAHEAAEVALETHLARVEDARGAYQAMATPLELVQTRSELFEEQNLEAFTAAMAAHSHAIAEPEVTAVPLDPLFSGANPDEEFVQAYRDAGGEERAQLAQASAEVVEDLEQLTVSLDEANEALAETSDTSHRAALALAQSLPERVDSLVAEYSEAEESVAVAMHDAVADGEWDLDAEDIAEQMRAVQDQLIVYIENADRLRGSHDEAVAAREEAERRAEEAASTRSGGGGGVRMCNRFIPGLGGSPGYLALVPCSG